MIEELEEAIESARSVGCDRPLFATQTRKQHSKNLIIAIVKHVLGELPDHLSVREVLEELE